MMTEHHATGEAGSTLGPGARAEAQRILDRAARQLLAAGYYRDSLGRLQAPSADGRDGGPP